MKHTITIPLSDCDALYNGEKPFYVVNNKCEYQKGDTIVFEVQNKGSTAYHPICAKAYKVTFVSSECNLCQGYVILGLKDITGLN